MNNTPKTYFCSPTDRQTICNKKISTISHGTAATPFTCGGNFNDHFVANRVPSPTVKEFVKIG